MIPAPAASIRRTAAIVLLAVLVGSSLLVGPVTAERAQVAQPVQTAQTGQPGQPVQPVQPAQPGQPVQPAQPGQPVQTAPVAQQSHPAQTAGGTVVVEANETVDSVEALGGTVVVRGTVANDVEALGGTVRIADTGRVGGDVDATGGSIGIDGTVNGTVQAVGGSVVIGESARIGGDLDVAAGSLTLAGTVGRDVRAAAETIRVDASASVGGDLRYDAETFDLADGAAIEGQVVQEEGLGDRIGGGFGAPSIPWWVWTGFWFVANLLLGAVLVGLLPSFSRGIAAEVVDHPLRSGGVGLGVLVGLPILLGLLAITLVGLPLALLGLGAYVALLWIGTVYGAYAVGAWGLGLGGTENRWLALVVGLVAVAVLGAVPYLGELVEFLVLVLGLGALTVALWQRFRGEEEAEEPGDRQATVDERDDRPTSS